jgi:hypothetical protein
MFMQTQFFMNCAHINVIGPGGGSLDGYPFVKFPGAYDYMDEGKSSSSLEPHVARNWYDRNALIQCRYLG